MDRHGSKRRLLYLTAICALLIACTPATEPASGELAGSRTGSPDVTIVEAPDQVCRTATQVRLNVQTTESFGAETPAEWELRTASGEGVQQGSWILRDGPLLIPLPADRAPAAGRYTVVLTWQGDELAGHTFTIDPEPPTLSDLSISTTPEGASLSELPMDLRVAYISYSYGNACVGSPFWVTVRDGEGEVICSYNDVLQDLQGRGTFACYREDGATLDPGTYRIEMTLADETYAEAGFSVESPVVVSTPTAVPSPTPVPVACDDLFAAAGITPEGEPYLSLELFDWYTEVVYAGARCRNLSEETEWQSAWYLEGTLVREAEGRWSGAPDSVVWDALTGTPQNPFLAPGVYTVTLTVADVPLTTTFSVFDYALRDTAEETPSAPTP